MTPLGSRPPAPVAALGCPRRLGREPGPVGSQDAPVSALGLSCSRPASPRLCGRSGSAATEELSISQAPVALRSVSLSLSARPQQRQPISLLIHGGLHGPRAEARGAVCLVCWGPGEADTCRRSANTERAHTALNLGAAKEGRVTPRPGGAAQPQPESAVTPPAPTRLSPAGSQHGPELPPPSGMLWAAKDPPWATPAPQAQPSDPREHSRVGRGARTAGEGASAPRAQHRRQGPARPAPSHQEGPVPAPLDVGEGGAASLPENRACPWPAQPLLELRPALQTGVPTGVPSLLL